MGIKFPKNVTSGHADSHELLLHGLGKATLRLLAKGTGNMLGELFELLEVQFCFEEKVSIGRGKRWALKRDSFMTEKRE